MGRGALPLAVGDLVMDGRYPRLSIGRNGQHVAFCAEPVGVVDEVRPDAFFVRWETHDDVGSYRMGYDWAYLDLGIRKLDRTLH